MLKPLDRGLPIDLRRIRHFVVLAETLNFRRAAERLNMSQPPLSVSIQKLEAEVGTKLFLRSPSGVTLTPSGRAALSEAKRLLFHATQFAQLSRDAHDGTAGTLHIGFVGSATFGMLQKIVPLFRAAQPAVELVLREATSVGIMQALEDRTLDVGLVRTPLLRASSATSVALERDHYIAALPRGHALTSRANLKLAELAGEQFVMYAPTFAAGLHASAMLACQQAGFVPRVAQEAIQIQTVLALVESGLGVALVPSVMRRYGGHGIVYRDLEDMPAEAAIGLSIAYMADTESAAAQRFRALAVKEWSRDARPTPTEGV